ncbi:hypothetical protein Trydic_g10943 [Trypoxylus dichotomus]
MVACIFSTAQKASRFVGAVLLKMALFSTSPVSIAKASIAPDVLCVTPEHDTVCHQINKQAEDIQCTILEDELSCIEKVIEGTIHFTSVSSEAAFLAEPETILDIFEIKRESELYGYQIAIFVNKDVANGLRDIQNFSYCFPGIDLTDVNPQFLMEFERVVLFENGKDICTYNQLPLIEKHIKAIHDYFGLSCRPGRWTPDSKIDSELKKKYSKLMALCNSTSYKSNKGMAFTEALNCAINSKNPAVAVTTLDTITDLRNTRNFTAYTICKNGSISSKNLCGWSGMNKVIVVKRDIYADLFIKLTTWLPVFSEIIEAIDGHNSKTEGIYKMTIPDSSSSEECLAFSYDLKQVLLPNLISGEDYEIIVSSFTDFRNRRKCLAASQSKECGIKVRWCTTSDAEQRKCKAWSRASLNNAVEPAPSCLKKYSKRICIEAIKTNDTDVMTIDADLGYFAKLYTNHVYNESYENNDCQILSDGLETIAYLIPERQSLIRTMLVVKSNIISLENLKGKKACFPLYGGVPWLSFVEVIRSILLNNATSAYERELDDILGSSCMPGAEYLGTKNLCSLCVKISTIKGATCAADATNKYYGNKGALYCLKEVGDFAVITVTDDLILPEDVHVICKNGSVTDRGLNIDDNCFLTIIPAEEIIARQGDPKNLDIQLMLKESERRFLQDPRAPFKLFRAFNADPNMLFKDTTLGVELPSSENHLVKNHQTLFRHVRAGSSVLTGRNGSGRATFVVHWILPILMLIIRLMIS